MDPLYFEQNKPQYQMADDPFLQFQQQNLAATQERNRGIKETAENVRQSRAEGTRALGEGIGGGIAKGTENYFDQRDKNRDFNLKKERSLLENTGLGLQNQNQTTQNKILETTGIRKAQAETETAQAQASVLKGEAAKTKAEQAYLDAPVDPELAKEYSYLVGKTNREKEYYFKGLKDKKTITQMDEELLTIKQNRENSKKQMELAEKEFQEAVKNNSSTRALAEQNLNNAKLQYKIDELGLTKAEREKQIDQVLGEFANAKNPQERAQTINKLENLGMPSEILGAAKNKFKEEQLNLELKNSLVKMSNPAYAQSVQRSVNVVQNAQNNVLFLKKFGKDIKDFKNFVGADQETAKISISKTLRDMGNFEEAARFEKIFSIKDLTQRQDVVESFYNNLISEAKNEIQQQLKYEHDPVQQEILENSLKEMGGVPDYSGADVKTYNFQTKQYESQSKQPKKQVQPDLFGNEPQPQPQAPQNQPPPPPEVTLKGNFRKVQKP